MKKRKKNNLKVFGLITLLAILAFVILYFNVLQTTFDQVANTYVYKNPYSQRYGQAFIDVTIKTTYIYDADGNIYSPFNMFAKQKIECSGSRLYIYKNKFSKQQLTGDWGKLINCNQNGCSGYSEVYSGGTQVITLRDTIGQVPTVAYVCWGYNEAYNGDWVWAWTGYGFSNNGDVINTVTQEAIALRKELEKKMTEIKSLQTTIDQKVSLINQLQLDSTRLSLIISELNLNIEQKTELIKKLQLQSAEQAIIIKNLQITLDEKIEIVKSLQTEIDKQAELIDNLALNLKEKAEMIKLLTSENSIQANLIKQMGDSFEKQRDIILNMNLLIEDDAELIKNMNFSIENEAKLISLLYTKLEDQQKLISLLNKNLDESKKLADELELANVLQREKYTFQIKILIAATVILILLIIVMWVIFRKK